MFPHVAALLVSGFALLCATATGVAQDGPEAASASRPGHYLLVIDHSGSMNIRIRSGEAQGRTRWELMRERAVDFVERLPEGSNLWGIVFRSIDSQMPQQAWSETFEQTIASDDDRNEVLEFLRNYPAPANRNGTALYDAVGAALRRAEVIVSQDPSAYTTVLVYTDGVDQGAGPANSGEQGSREFTREQIAELTAELKRRNRNFALVDVYTPHDESIRDAHIVRLQTNRFTLPSLRDAPRQEVELRFSFRDTDLVALEGGLLGIVARGPEGGEPPPARVVDGPYQLVNGAVRVALEAEPHAVEAGYSKAVLQLAYEAPADVHIVGEGGEEIELEFQVDRSPEIRDLRPQGGSEFPVDHEIEFSLSTLEGADVLWDFGGGDSARGAVARHRYASAGDREVSVKVTDLATGLSAEASVAFRVVDLRLLVDPPSEPVKTGDRVRLTATATGTFLEDSYQWVIEGQVVAGQPRSDGRPGTEIEYRFPRAGEYRVEAHGRTERARVASPELSLVVEETPRLRLVSPVTGETLYYGEEYEIIAELEGVTADHIVLAASDAEGEPLMDGREAGVSLEGAVRRARTRFRLPLSGEPRTVVFRASPPEGSGLAPAETEVRIEDAPAEVFLVSLEGPELRWGRPGGFELRSNRSFEEVRWNFDDGAGTRMGGMVEEHAYRRYGSFRVAAEALAPDGTPTPTEPVEVLVSPRPVEAAVRVVYAGREVGREIAKVPVNSTVLIENLSEGDITSVVRYLNGERLPPGQDTVALGKRPVNRVRLEIEATPESVAAAEAEFGTAVTVAEVAFHTRDRVLFFSGLAALLLLLGGLARLLLGNKWRHAEFGMQRVAGPALDGDPGAPDAGGLARITGDAKRRVGSWSYWRKEAILPLEKLDGATCQSWDASDRLRFRGGRDPKLDFHKGSRRIDNPVQATDARRLRGRWERRWTIVRPLEKSRPERIGAVFLRRRAYNPLVRWWPEALFAVALVASLFALRTLAAWYY